MPVKTAPLWYAIDRSVLVVLPLELAVFVDAFCAVADPTSTARASARAIVTLPMSLDFMAVLLCVLVKGYRSTMFGYKTNGFLRLGTVVPPLPLRGLNAAARPFCERGCPSCTAGTGFFGVLFRDVDRAFPGRL